MCKDRITAQKAMQIFSECFGGVVALTGLFCEAFHDDCFQITRDLGCVFAEKRRLLLDHFENDVNGGGTDEWRTPTNTLIKRGTQAIDICAAVQLLTTTQLFWGHV